MKFLVKIMLLVCLCNELNCLQIKKCFHSQKILTSPQNTPLVVGCETDKTLQECTLKRDNHPDQSCTYHYIWNSHIPIGWSWVVKSCFLDNVVSNYKNYSHCEFSLPSISLSGKQISLIL